MALQVTSCTMSKNLDRLRNKGASYFRSRTNSQLFAHRRKSAVELLEASKPEYVKSRSVLNHRQEPGLKSRDRDKTINTQPGRRSKSEFDLSRILTQTDSDEGGNESIEDSLRSPVLPVAKQTTPKVIFRVASDSSNSESAKINMSDSGKAGTPVSASTSWRLSAPCGSVSMENSVNVPKKEMESSTPWEKLGGSLLKPINFRPLSASVGVLVEQRCASPAVSSSHDSSVQRRQKKALHRSQSDLSSRRNSRASSEFSDLSSRLSRTSTELERFFNEMGLDRCVLQPMIQLQKTGKGDLDLFESVSSCDSPESRSLCSELSRGEKGPNQNDSDIMERSMSQTSIVERNARIIKWLCNVKKARTSRQQPPS